MHDHFYTRRFSQRAFTLIEMLVVVVIIGILAGVLVPRLVGARERASDSARIVKVGQLTTAVELYAQENGEVYPIATLTDTGTSVATIADKITTYLTSIPTDPGKGTIAINNPPTNIQVTGDSFAYYTDSAGTMFAITALMESKKGNTTNAVGMIDSDKQGGFQVVGKGLSTPIPPYDPTKDGDPIAWCKANLTQAEADAINVMMESTDTIDQMCSRYSAWSDTYPLPSGLGKLVYLHELELYEPRPTPTTFFTFANLPSLSLSIPNGLNSLEDFYIYHRKLDSIVFPDSVTNLGRCRIESSTLTSVTLPKSLGSLVRFDIVSPTLSSIEPKAIVCPQIAKFSGDISNWGTANVCPGY